MGDQSGGGERVIACRSCGSGGLVEVLSLGETPVANALVDPEAAPDFDPTFPLEVVFCHACALVQLGYVMPAGRLFDDQYPYFSAFSETYGQHAARHVTHLVQSRRLDGGSLAVEVASNDGSLLRHFVRAGVRAVGIDPAPGPADAAERIGVSTIVGFFGVEAAQSMRDTHGAADVIVANNVLAHVPDLADFVGGFAVLLADDGVLTVENPYVRDLVEHVEFDTIYHEHFCYFSCSSVDALMERHGLHLQDVEYFPDLHGGTLRWSIGRARRRSARCDDWLASERAAGMTTVEYYSRFADSVHLCQGELVALIDRLTGAGRRVAAYGAAAKGATLLNSTGIGAERIEYVVDRNVHKQGKLMPGCRLLIRPVEVLLEDRPDDVLVLAWNFVGEIVAQQRAFTDRGGTFYVPVPRPRRIDAEGR